MKDPHPLRIVIVENEKNLAEALQIMLQNEDAFICERIYSNGEDAALEIPKIEPDIALVDIDLGENRMSGIEMIALLKTKCPMTLFMVLTIYEDSQKVYDALSAGALGYILKTDTPSKIINAITDLKEGGSPMSPTIARKITSFFTPTSSHVSAYTELLSAREKEVIELISKGRIEKEVAADLYISVKTVKAHISNIYTKLHVRTRVEALNKYFGR